jgi:hypothetical protein
METQLLVGVAGHCLAARRNLEPWKARNHPARKGVTQALRKGPTPVNRIDQIRRRAVALARSGDHDDLETMEAALSEEGFLDPHQALVDPVVRGLLHRLCAAGQGLARPDASPRRNAW